MKGCFDDYLRLVDGIEVSCFNAYESTEEKRRGREEVESSVTTTSTLCSPIQPNLSSYLVPMMMLLTIKLTRVYPRSAPKTAGYSFVFDPLTCLTNQSPLILVRGLLSDSMAEELLAW